MKRALAVLEILGCLAPAAVLAHAEGHEGPAAPVMAGVKGEFARNLDWRAPCLRS